MKRYYGATYHALALLHHVYAMKYTTEIEFHKSTDERIVEMELFANRYFTGWNIAIQTFYLILAVTADILHLFPENFRKYENKLLVLKGYIFTTFMFPCTLFVAAMFWGVYSINREWVLPAAVDAFVPEWLNHSMHTLILVPAIMEILITNHLLPSFKSAFIGLSVLLLIYDALFFYTYYQCGRWLYGLFYVFSWEERTYFMIMNYVCVVAAMKAGFVLQNYKGKWAEILYNYINWPTLVKVN